MLAVPRPMHQLDTPSTPLDASATRRPQPLASIGRGTLRSSRQQGCVAPAKPRPESGHPRVSNGPVHSCRRVRHGPSAPAAAPPTVAIPRLSRPLHPP